ncbi:MAG: GPW/gp25 family protein [Proteobacteria bacterium]|nr:GPW/gp25 family protein [Pseudomonadota bacterium]
MPIERVSKSFKDISSSFQISPMNFDLIVIKNETAIARSIRNLVFTLPGERFFNENLGSRISNSLFENIDNTSAGIIQDEIQNTIQNYEPRVDLISVEVLPNYEENSFDVNITYNIVGIDVLPQQLTFALEQTR